MDGSHFDTLTRSLTIAGSRRRALSGLLAGALGLLGWPGVDDAAAHDLKAKCKKKSGEAKKKCLKKAKKHNATHLTQLPPPPGPVPVPVRVYQCPEPSSRIDQGQGNARFAQTFIALESGTLHQIQIGVQKSANTGDYVVQLLKATGGTPSHLAQDVLATVTVPDATVPMGQATVTATFAGPVLVEGLEYAAAISRPRDDVDFIVRSHGGTGTRCTGAFFYAEGTAAFTAITGLDIVTSVFVI